MASKNHRTDLHPRESPGIRCGITKGLGRSRADRGLKFGEYKGAAFAPSCNLNAFYETFMTGAFCLIRLGRSTKKYLRTNIPWRPRIEPPQLKHLTSRSGIGWGGASMRTISYFAPQLGQSNGTDCESDIRGDPPNRRPSVVEKKSPNRQADWRLNHVNSD